MPALEFLTQPKNTRAAPLPREASVIVDTLGQTRALVDDLCKCGPDDEGPIVQSLLRAGADALDVLIERFPGPLWFDRRRPYERLPFGRDTGPIARLVGLRRGRTHAHSSLLRADNPDVHIRHAVRERSVHPSCWCRSPSVYSTRIHNPPDGATAARMRRLPARRSRQLAHPHARTARVAAHATRGHRRTHAPA
jgi:hypothetical protein